MFGGQVQPSKAFVNDLYFYSVSLNTWSLKSSTLRQRADTFTLLS